MTEFRTIDQVQADFRRQNPQDPQFTRISRLSDLQVHLTDDLMGDASLYASGGGPVLFNLGVLNGPDWEGVNRFLDSRLVTARARGEFRQLERDVRAADRNHDGVLNNQEIVRFAQIHTDRWANVAQFRSAAEIFLNRLPAYLAQTNLDQRQVARVWGVMNHIAQEHRRMGTPDANRGTVYGLSLEGFPSEDQDHPPALIRSLLDGTATPEQLAAVHHILETQRTGDTYRFQETAPLTPMDIGMLGVLLERASAAGNGLHGAHDLHGMTIVSGDQETELFRERNEAAQRCMDGIRTSMGAPGQAGLQEAFTGCSTDMARLEGRNPDRIGARALLMRAYTGDLSPAETALLRTWMQEEAGRLGMTCNGTLDCLAQGAMQLFQGIARDPWHFIARNGAFIGGSLLFRRLVLRNAFENRLSQACGGTVVNPRDAYRQYERHLSDQMRNSPAWRRFLNQLARNPRRESLLGRAFINFPVTFAHLAAFNAIAARKDTGNNFIDIPTDLPLIPLFEAFDTYDAFNRTAIQRFAQANPGLCRPQGQAAAQPAEATAPAPAPEQSRSAQRVPLSEEALRGLSHEQVLDYIRGPYADLTQPQFEATMRGAPALTSAQISDLPQELQTLFEEDLHWGRAAEPQTTQLRSLSPRVADRLVERYAPDNPELAGMIREDVGAILDVAVRRPDTPTAEVTAGIRWALREYIGNLQSGGLIRASFYVPMIQDGGLASTYMAIRASQECDLGCIGRRTSFSDAARENFEMRATSLYNRLHSETWTHARSSSSSDSSEAYDMMPRNAQGQPIIFIPLPCGMAGSALGALRSLFGWGGAAVEAEQGIQWGAYAFAGGA